MTNTATLQDFATAKATELKVPGVAVGMVNGGVEEYAFAGVTNVENPLPVDAETLFQCGSTTKTFTATAIMRLVEQGLVELDAPVRRYLPELELTDSAVAEAVTVLQLLNHTAGWSGDLMTNTGDGDDALARYVALMATIEQVTPLGEGVSYNNASLSLAGRLIEKVTGVVYEQAIRDLLLTPLGMAHSYFFANEVITRRSAAGHHQAPDGTITVSRNWAVPRSMAPAGGLVTNAADQIAWANFHLGDGSGPDGQRLLSAELLARMQQPSADMAGSALGDAVGISWLLKDLEGVRLVSHGGTTNGQHSEFVLVPERGFALISMTNCGPNGPEFNKALLAWALEHYQAIAEHEPERLELGETERGAYTGAYETIAASCLVTVGESGLVLHVSAKPGADSLGEPGDDAAADDQPPFPLALVVGDGDPFVVTDGPAQGMRGYFARDAAGRITGVHVGGRMATKV